MAAERSMCGLRCELSTVWILGKVSLNICATSCPTSKHPVHIEGPMTTLMRCGTAPMPTMPETAFPAIPATVPRQPECTAVIMPAVVSAISTGTQSAVLIHNAKPFTLVTMPSVSSSGGKS